MSYRFRMYPRPDQGQAMARHCADARYVWNLALEQLNYWRPALGSTPNYLERSRQLGEARRSIEWLGEGSSMVQGAALRDFDQAVQNWWRGSHRRPTWRKAGVHEGFVIRNLSFHRISGRWCSVHVPKIGHVRFRITRDLELLQACKTGRVTLDRSGRWHVSFVAPQPPVERTATGVMAGVDLGVAASATTSAGAHLRMPSPLSDGERERKVRLQRRLARQQKGSNRRQVTKRQLARLAAREADRRRDWIEKATTTLVRDHDLVAIEDLKVKNMVRRGRGKRGLNREIHAQSWASFRCRLEDKATAATTPCVVVAINPANTSLRCAICAHTAPENRESQAVFRCRGCGHTANADVNAARNILAAGLVVTGRGADVRPPLVAVGAEASTEPGSQSLSTKEEIEDLP